MLLCFTVSVNAQVAKVGDTEYATINEAIANCTNGTTLTLLADLNMSDILTINKAITLDGNGKTLTYTGYGTSARAIDVPAADGVKLEVTIKNLTVDCTASYCQRGINYNDDGKLTLEGVTVKGTNVTYALNLPGSSDNCEVAINNSSLTGNIALNVWGENSTINAVNTTFTAVDNNTEEGYAAVKLNNDGTTSAEGSVITITGGKIDVTGSACTDTEATSNGTSTGKINISESTVVNGKNAEMVAVIRYADGNSYSFMTIEDAIEFAKAGETVTLLRDITASNIITINKAITLDGNGKTLTSTAGRAINVSGAEANGVTIKNLTINASGERAINVIQNATNVTVDNVTATAKNYTVNVAASAPNAVVAISKSTLNGLCTVNVSAAGAQVTVDNSTVNCNDNNTTAGESYAALSLNKEAVGGSIVATNSTVNVAEGSDSMKGRNGAENGTVTINGSTEGVAVIVAAITYSGSNYYHAFATIEDAVKFAKEGETITLIRDVTMDYNARDAYETQAQNVVINGNGKTLTLNQKNSDWASFGLANNSKLVLKNMTIEKTGYGDTSGAWNTHAIIFTCPVEMNDVTVNNSIAVQAGATLNNVDIVEANGYYGLWINGNGQAVEVNGGSITATNGGRGIKIADQYVDAPAQVTLSVTGTVFETAQKAAVLVSSKAGANITASDVDITNVAADNVNFVWVDEDWAEYFSEVEVNGATVSIEGAGSFAAAITENGAVKGYYKTLAEALTAAADGDTVTLIWSEDNAPIAMNGSVFGKNVTITGTAKVDWSKGFLFVGRGGEGNATVTFDGANLTSASNSASYGIHVSGREKNTDNKYDGTLVINNSTIDLDYLINKGAMTLDKATLAVKNGFSVGGRPASETENGQDATATISLTNESKLVVNNHNGMGLGYEAIGVMNIDNTSTFETTESFLVTAKGTMNIAGKAIVAGTLTNKGVINLTAEGATLKAQEGLTVNSTVEGRDVSYADGVYSTKLGLKGKGTEAEPFLIGNIEELMAFRNSVNGGETKYSAPGVYVALAADIDMAGENWVGIGSATADHGFMGNFDGKGYTIKNLTITNPALNSDGYAYAGFFGVTEGTDQNNQNTIKNLTIENVTITTTGHIAAAAVAYPYYTIIDNVKVCGDIAISGGDYTAGVLAYTRRCVNASNLSIVGNDGSFVKGNQTVGGVISDIQMNGGLTADYKNFSAEGLTISGAKQVGGISGIIATQTLDGASVKNVALSCSDARVGIVSGCLGGTSTISNVTYENVTGATALIGSSYKDAKAVAAKIGDTYYATLEDALAAKGNEVVELLVPYVVAKGETVTLDLNGKTVTGTPSEAKAYAVITNYGTLTISNGSVICNHTLAGSTGYAVNTITNCGTLTIEDATIENKSTAQYQIGYAIDNNSTSADAVVNIKGGKVVASGSSYYDGIRQFCNSQTKENGIVVSGGEVSTIWMQNPSDGATKNTKDVKGSVAISGGKVGILSLEPSANFEAAVTGGHFGEISYFQTAEGRDLKGFITGGTFYNLIDETFLAMGYQLTGDAAPYTVAYTGEVTELVLVDGEVTEFVNEKEITVGTLTYKRSNIKNTWTPFYVPFAVPVSALADKFDVAYINDVRRTDSDDDGELDKFSMEIIYIHGGNANGSAKTLKANYPYFIRSKSGQTETMEITLTNAKVYAKENVFDCTTMTEKFEIKGNYHQIPSDVLTENDYVVGGGEWHPLADGYSLNPFRFYMTMSSRYEDEPVAPMKSMRITVRGEEDENGATIIYDVVEENLNNNGNDFIYDLQGRRVSEPKKGGIYIKNGKKILY